MYEPIGGRELLARRYENTIKQITSFYFYKMQGGSAPSYRALLNRWEKLWFKDETTAYDLSTDQHETIWGNPASYTTTAAYILREFHKHFEGYVGTPVMINEPYSTAIGASVRIDGTIDLVLRDKDMTYNVVKWVGRRRRPAMSTLEIDFAVLKYLFEFSKHAFVKPDVTVKYWVYDLGSNRPGFVPVKVDKDSVDKMLFWVNRIVDNPSPAPRRGYVTYCKSCPFDKPCLNYKHPTNEGQLVEISSKADFTDAFDLVLEYAKLDDVEVLIDKAQTSNLQTVNERIAWAMIAPIVSHVGKG
jgi:hypothetical protein